MIGGLSVVVSLDRTLMSIDLKFTVYGQDFYFLAATQKWTYRIFPPISSLRMIMIIKLYTIPLEIEGRHGN